VSLRTALASLPDDRATASAVREVVSYAAAHRRQAFPAERIVKATGMTHDRIDPVLRALCDCGVLHCDGDPCLHDMRFDPDSVLELEIARFLRASGTPEARLQASVGKYRNRLG
jgi:hypothetical protein